MFEFECLHLMVHSSVVLSFECCGCLSRCGVAKSAVSNIIIGCVCVAMCPYMLLYVATCGRLHTLPCSQLQMAVCTHRIACVSIVHVESHTDVTVDVQHIVLPIVSHNVVIVSCECMLCNIRFAWLFTCLPACRHMATAMSVGMNLSLAVMYRASAQYIDVICIVCECVCD
jgi:hypothetical protein